MIFHGFRRASIRITGQRGAALTQARGRLVLISAIFALAYVLIAVRVVDLTLIHGKITQEQAGFSALHAGGQSDPVMRRADIYDRNGVLLATTLKMASLYADPKFIQGPDEAAQGLVKIFPNLSYGDVLQKLQSDKRFIWIKRNLTPDEQYAVLELGQPGLRFSREDRRVYPQGKLAAHVIGYTNIDNRGLAGIERRFDNFLGGGKTLNLTIDIRLQHVLRREITKAMEDFTALAGAGVIMDVKNGEVLAGVSLPDFDPNNAGAANDNEIFNHLTLGVYELGSLFKIFSTAALLETYDPPMSMTFDASEPIKIGRFTINDYHAENRVLTIPEIFMHSSNIGAALMGRKVGTQALRSFYEDLGLLTKMEIEIDEVGAPLVPSPWREVSTLTASYGHGIATTPLQLASAVSIIINGGFSVKPKFVLNNIRNQKNTKMSPKKNDLRIVSPQTAQSMRKLLRLVVTDGTGKNADVPGYAVGGKTGTAEKIGAKGYDRKRLISSFVGVFPMDAPRYVVLVVVDEPKGNKKSFGYATGGWVAAPAVARIISGMGAILGLPGQNSERDIGASLKQYVHDKDGNG